jgi:hypothetical protein
MQPEDNGVVYVRPSGRVGRAYSFLRRIGGPATIAEIVEGIGEPPEQWRIFGVRTSINAYAAKGKLFRRLKGDRVQILDGAEVRFGCRPPKEGGVTETMIIRARVRLFSALSPGRGVMTPTGVVFSRPSACQWCYEAAVAPKKGRYSLQLRTEIKAWHILPYGPAANDLFVIFLCSRCTALFGDAEPLKLITERFAVQLKENQQHPQIAAILLRSVTVCSNSTRRNL